MSLGKYLVIPVFILMFCAGNLLIGQEPPVSGVQAWVENPEMRLTPASFSRERRTIAKAEAFRNEVVSLQIAIRASEQLPSISASCEGAESGVVKDLPCAWEGHQLSGS